MAETYHIPVMLEETIDALNIEENGVYADVTFGGGGHSRAILQRYKNIKIIALDKDIRAKENADKLIKEMNLTENQFQFFRADYKYLKNFIDYTKHEKINGILADLGVSSHHLDERTRGFSYRKNADLDMRMNQDAKQNAVQVINEYSLEQLTDIFRKYGELKKAKFIASLIVKARTDNAIQTIQQLNDAIAKALPKYNEYKVLSQVYQAIRIEVNNELKGLERLLDSTPHILKPDARLAILTYHSLEDRIVKNFINFGNTAGTPYKDVYGNITQPFKWIKPKYRTPQPQEIEINSRAASAKLRTAYRTLENIEK